MSGDSKETDVAGDTSNFVTIAFEHERNLNLVARTHAPIRSAERHGIISFGVVFRSYACGAAWLAGFGVPSCARL